MRRCCCRSPTIPASTLGEFGVRRPHTIFDGFASGKTKLYPVIDTLGQWSFIDPFSTLVCASLVPLGQVAHIQVGGAIPTQPWSVRSPELEQA